MGHLQAAEMAAYASLDVALHWHLRSNHYPPLPLALVETCKAAIDAFNDGDCDRLVEMPDGILFRGCDRAPASAIVSSCHLDAFCDQVDDW